MKKKVGIVTFYSSASYGATLQSLATYITLKNMGFDCEFVNYKNKYEQNKNKIQRKNIIGKIKYSIRECKSFLLMNKYWKNKSFGDVYSLYDNKISKNVYNSIEELENEEYDILLSGSDQIWNPIITGGIDEFYLLNFGKCKKRVSYASSLGSYILTDDDKKVFEKCINNINEISVREKHAKEQLEQITNKDIKIVIDPTLLLSKEEWLEFFKDKKCNYDKFEQKYILAYFVGGKSDIYYKEINELKEKTGLPIYEIHINKHKRHFIDKVLPGVNIADFINLINNSEYFITDSFHGVVFSLILEKKFVPLKNKKNPIRVRELLEKVGLDERLDNIQLYDDSIDYAKISNCLEKLRIESYNWLKKALEDKNEE